MSVCVRNGLGEPVLSGGWTDPDHDKVRRSMSFVFTDWTIAIGGLGGQPTGWVATNLAINMALSVGLAVVLLAAVAYALRTASRELRLSAMKNDFVSNVSHELRTPLSSIRVFGEFMRRGRVSEPEKIREYGRYIETESRRLTQLINNILDFSRIESGRRVYTYESADLEEIVTGTLETFAVRLRNKGFSIELESPDAPLPDMVVDPAAVDRAVANLIDNAVKYSGEGKGIQVCLDRRDDEVTIAVADDGIGIPREEQERIFERFHRVSTGLVHDVRGTGLGLSLVRHIMMAHGGRVEVESEPGKGSVFTLVFPLGFAPEEA